MTAPAPDIIGTGIAGTDFDPYKDQDTDTLVLLFAWWPALARFLSQYTGFTPFHNYRQWHVFEQSLTAGWNNGAIKLGFVPAIPACPILWQDVSHYWNFGGVIGIIIYELVAYIRIVIIFAMLIIMTQWGHMTPADAAKIVLQQFGIVV
jgi:hypothetical protein